MSENDSHTSRDEASEAARIMQDPNVSPTERSVAASDLSQADRERDQRS